MKYEPVMGIEVHVELNTKTKMFCRCSADYFGKQPNTHTCPVCLGLPGALPYINEEAIKKCIQIGLALNCSVAEKSLFERKNYFYPDLAKGYQISQYRWPLCVGGWLEVASADGQIKKIRINRAHQEEDTGKLTHTQGETLIDFNRSGVPLVEVVTEPDFSSSEEVRDYAKKLQQIFINQQVSNADMEKGDMRLEANVSVRQAGQQELPSYRVELKNINSFRFMVAAIEFEIKRQVEALEKGEKLTQETRGWDEEKKCTYLQRSKEEAHDYRYFPEPDLPELNPEKSKVQEIELEVKKLMLNHPDSKRETYLSLGLSQASASTIANSELKSSIFDLAEESGYIESSQITNFGNYLANKGIILSEENLNISAKRVADDFNQQKQGIISGDEELEKYAKEVIKQNPKAVEDYKKGKENALQVLVGGVMKLSSGKADAALTIEILKKLLLK